jgi:peptide/nickel transport system substrate-binding protein
MRKRRRASATVVALGMLTAFGLSSSAQAQDASPSAGEEPLTFIVGLTNNMVTVNPLRAIEAPEYELLGMQYNLLFNFAQDDMSAVPGLATEIPTKENGGLSADGLTWTLNIRDDVTWSDGEPLTAEDIAFTYNLILDQNWSNFTNYLPFTDSITAPNDTTLVWKTTEPSIAPLIPPWIYILPEHIFGGMTKDEIRQYDNFDPETGEPVTSGPFHLVEWNKDEDWTLEANKDYFEGAPTLDRVIFKRYTNPETMVQDLRAGEIDFAESIPVELFRSLEGQEGIQTNVGGSFSFSQMSFNQCFTQKACEDSTGHPALRDVEVRQAIEMAIDKENLVERVLGGYGTPGTTIVVPTAKFWHWAPPEDEALPDGDIEAANAKLDAAGYVDSDGDGIRNMPNGGENLDFRFIVRTESPDGVKAGKLITGWMEQIGIKTTTQAVTDSKLIDLWTALDYDIYIWGWGPDPDPDFILSTFTTDQCLSWSDTCYSNPEYDALYEEQLTPETPEERQGIVQEMQQIIYEQVPEVVLWYDNDLQAWNSDRWEGFQLQPEPDANGDGGYALFQYGTYSYQNIRPASADAGSAGGGSTGIPAGVWIGILAAIVLIVGGVLFARSRGDDEEKA